MNKCDYLDGHMEGPCDNLASWECSGKRFCQKHWEMVRSREIVIPLQTPKKLMPDEIHFGKQPDGSEKKLYCFDGCRDVQSAMASLQLLIDEFGAKGLYLSKIECGREIPQDGGGAWGMTIENRSGNLALFTFHPIQKTQ